MTETETKILSDQEVAEIDARASMATEGSWHTAKRRPALIVAQDKARIADCHVGIGMPVDEAQLNSEFIAHAREDVPALCQTVRALRELVYVPKILPDDDEITYRDVAERLLRQNTALREQLAESERVVKMASSYERGARQKIEDLESQLAQVEKERDELRRTNAALIEDNQTVLRNFKPAVDAEVDRLMTERLKK